VGRLSVERMRSSVVLPAPFGPKSVRNSPSPTRRSTPRSTGRRPKALVTAVASIIAALLTRHLSGQFGLERGAARLVLEAVDAPRLECVVQRGDLGDERAGSLAGARR